MSCPAPPVVKNGYVSYDSLNGAVAWTTNDVVIYKCFKYYGLVDNDRQTCNGATWEGVLPKCEYHRNTESKIDFPSLYSKQIHAF